jgi:lipoprotein NlpI
MFQHVTQSTLVCCVWQVLFERGLEYHPKNTKIMLAYAKFEAEQGDIDVAAELHERALEVDPTSETTMQNRCVNTHATAASGVSS